MNFPKLSSIYIMISKSKSNPIKYLMSGSQTQNHICLSRLCSQLSSVNANQNQKSTEVSPIEIPNVDKLYKTIELEARSADSEVLKSYDMFVKMSANYLGITISRSWEPFRSIRRRTLLRSAFVKKKYRVQYEFRTYFRNIELKHMTGSTADTFLEYIERNLPEGVALKVYKTAIEAMPQHIRPTPLISSSTSDQCQS